MLRLVHSHRLSREAQCVVYGPATEWHLIWCPAVGPFAEVMNLTYSTPDFNAAL